MAANVLLKRAELGVRRVLIVDWDAHCEGTGRSIFEDDPRVMFVSLHRYGDGFYPGTGRAEETGRGEGTGFSVNVDFRRGGMGDAEYLAAFRRVVMPVAQAFAPDIVLVSAGFDSARGDPLGGMDVTPVGFAHRAHDRAAEHARARPRRARARGRLQPPVGRAGAEACVRARCWGSPSTRTRRGGRR